MTDTTISEIYFQNSIPIELKFWNSEKPTWKLLRQCNPAKRARLVWSKKEKNKPKFLETDRKTEKDRLTRKDLPANAYHKPTP